MRRACQGPGVPQRTQITRAGLLVGPWQYQCAGNWVLGGWLGSTLPWYPPSRTTPGTQPMPVQAMHRTGASAVTARLRSTKEILGVEYAQLDTGYWILGTGSWFWVLDPGSGYWF